MKKKIFICSPYRGRVEENKKNAVSYARITAMSGDVPIVPHLYFPSFLDDNIPNERNKGVAAGLGNVQKLRDGEPLGSRVNARDEFEAVDAEDDFLA